MKREIFCGKHRKPNNKGQGLLEILIALMVFCVTISAMVLLLGTGEAFTVSGEASTIALYRARNGLECTRIMRDNDWNQLSDGPHGLQFVNGLCQFSGTSDEYSGIVRTITVTIEPSGDKYVESKATWNASPGNPKQVVLIARYTPLDEGVSGDWKHAHIVGSANIGSGGSGTDIVYSQNRIYLTNSQSPTSASDLFIFNVTSPASPVLLGQINLEEGLEAVAVSGSFAYVVEENSTDFFIVNVSNPASPAQMSKLTLPGNGKGHAIEVRDTFAYVTTTTSSDKEFFVIDVSNPMAPAVISGLEFGVDVNDISIKSDIGYVATSDILKELQIIDLGDPYAPIATSSFNISEKGDALSIYAKSPARVYMGREDKDSPKDFIIFDATDPKYPQKIGEKNLGKEINDIVTAGSLAFLATSKNNEEFRVINILNANDIKDWDKLNLPGIGTGVAYHNNHTYVSVENANALQIITSQ